MQHSVSNYLISNARMLMMLMLTRVSGPGHDKYGPYMEVDQGEEDERIMEEMEADDVEHLAFCG
jgi:hypothetical protein